MMCPQCRKRIPGGTTFCQECGANLANVSRQRHGNGVESDGNISTRVQTSVREADCSLGDLPTRRVQDRDEGAKASDLSGTPLANRYAVIEEIGRGAFGVVYKAQDTRLERMVAVKRLHPDPLNGRQDDHTIERFAREAKSIAKLNHRNIVHVYDYARDTEGLYIAMEYADGPTLRDYLKEKGPLPVAEAIRIVRGIGHGLSVAHKHNLVHRDIKPANILLAHDGDELTPKIVDFGLARDGNYPSGSIEGYGLGTPYYMAPEQWKNARGVNHTADIYALGKTFYELLTGNVPDHVDPEALPPPPQLSEIVLKSIKSRPEDRYFSVDEFLNALDALHLGPSATVAPAAVTTAANACPNCGSGNPESVKFCECCGGGLTHICPECGHAASIFKEFCGSCGTDIKGFGQAEKGLALIERSMAAKHWRRVAKIHASIREDLSLPGERGRKLLSKIDRLTKEAAKQTERCREILRRLDEVKTSSNHLQEALDLMAEYQCLDPISAANTQIHILADDLKKRKNRKDFYIALAESARLSKAYRWEEALARLQAYRTRYPDGIWHEQAENQMKRAQASLNTIARHLSAAKSARDEQAWAQVVSETERALSLAPSNDQARQLETEARRILKRIEQMQRRASNLSDAGTYEPAIDILQEIMALTTENRAECQSRIRDLRSRIRARDAGQPSRHDPPTARHGSSGGPVSGNESDPAPIGPVERQRTRISASDAPRRKTGWFGSRIRDLLG